MDVDLERYFKRYEAIAATADAVFEKMGADFPECVACKPHCDDCCHALFDLTLIEALYVNHRFNQSLSARDREELLERANRADRDVYKLKRQAYKYLEAGREEADILADMARQRVRCPLLNDSKMCDLYEYRPITCRLYGIPTAIGGKGHTCGLSGFKEGTAYPTVQLDKIQQRLYDLSAELVADLKSRYGGLAQVLVPLSMALMTDYNDAYLGIGAEEEGTVHRADGKEEGAQ
jgi:Fe-S-cluster containining protein